MKRVQVVSAQRAADDLERQLVVVYRIDEEAHVPTILACFHHAQDRSDFRP